MVTNPVSGTLIYAAALHDFLAKLSVSAIILAVTVVLDFVLPGVPVLGIQIAPTYMLAVI